MTRVPLVDLGRSFEPLLPSAIERFEALARTGDFTLGSELGAFEEEFAAYCGAACCVGVANGTDALELALRALGVGPGDEVVVPAFTFVATAEAVLAAGATPVFVDVDPRTRNLDPRALPAALGERTAAVVAVHLYGRPAAVEEIAEICRRAAVPLVEDAAQAHGARIGERRAGSLGRVAAFSFFPTKNLGALGDGGAVVTDDSDLAAVVRSLRHHGAAPDDSNLHLRDGRCSRLDNLQAAMLRLKLPLLEEWNAERRALADRYREALAGLPMVLPADDEPGSSQVHHVFVVEVEERERVLAELRAVGVGAAVHYPLPVHLQPPWRERGHGPGDFPVAEQLASRVLSLPLFPGMRDDELSLVADALAAALTGAARGAA